MFIRLVLHHQEGPLKVLKLLLDLLFPLTWLFITGIRYSSAPRSPRFSGLRVATDSSSNADVTLVSSGQMVVEHSHMSGEVFSLYLHQNYLDFFTEMEDVVQASTYLSDADLLTACWTVGLPSTPPPSFRSPLVDCPVSRPAAP